MYNRSVLLSRHSQLMDDPVSETSSGIVLLNDRGDARPKGVKEREGRTEGRNGEGGRQYKGNEREEVRRRGRRQRNENEEEKST